MSDNEYLVEEVFVSFKHSYRSYWHCSNLPQIDAELACNLAATQGYMNVNYGTVIKSPQFLGDPAAYFAGMDGASHGAPLIGDAQAGFAAFGPLLNERNR